MLVCVGVFVGVEGVFVGVEEVFVGLEEVDEVLVADAAPETVMATQGESPKY